MGAAGVPAAGQRNVLSRLKRENVRESGNIIHGSNLGWRVVDLLDAAVALRY
jgi:hypothetical protein